MIGIALFLAELFPVFQAFPQQLGAAQAIGALAFASAAAAAVFHLFHLLAPFLGHVLLPGRAAQQLGQAGDGVDLDAFPAGHTIAAATTEVPGQFFPVLFDDGLKLRRHGDFLLGAIQKLLQLISCYKRGCLRRLLLQKKRRKK